MGHPRTDQDLDGGRVTFDEPEPDHFDQMDDKSQDHVPISPTGPDRNREEKPRKEDRR